MEEMHVRQYNILDEEGTLINSFNSDELDKYIKMAQKYNYTILDVYDDYKVVYPKKENTIAFVRVEEDEQESKLTIRNAIKKLFSK